jgi:hypothetical protein
MTMLELRMLFVAGFLLVTLATVVATVALFAVARWIAAPRPGPTLRARPLRGREAARWT